jgi:ABC-2 type transport system permease protein
MQEASLTLYWICLLNPFTHGVELIRFALYGQVNLLSLAVVAGTGMLFFALAVLAYDPGRGVLPRRGGAELGHV